MLFIVHYNNGTELGRLQFRASSYTYVTLQSKHIIEQIHGVCIWFAKDEREWDPRAGQFKVLIVRSSIELIICLMVGATS